MFSQLRTLILTGILVAIVSSQVVAETHFWDPLQGYVRPEARGDSLEVDYDLILNRPGIDSLVLVFYSEIEWRTGIVHLGPGVSIGNPPRGTRWKGRQVFPWLYPNVPNTYSVLIYELGADTASVNAGLTEEKLSCHPSGVGGRQATIGMGWFTKEGFTSPVHSDAHGILLHLEDRIGYFDRNFSIYFGYSVNHSTRFTLYKYASVGTEAFLWGRDRWRPSFHAGVSYARIKGYEDPIKSVKKGLDGEFGVGLDGRFESLRYTFNTAFEGYHRVDLALSLIAHADGQQRIGTMYSLYNGEYVNGFGVYIYMQGWGLTNALQYHNNRPFLHKALAVVGWVPCAPFILLFSLVDTQ